MIRRDHMLASILDPFHRLAELARGERDEKVLRIELAAHAERAADIGLDHVDGLDRYAAEHLRKRAPVLEIYLGRAPKRELAVARHDHQASRLERHGAVAMTAKAPLAHVCRPTEGVADLTDGAGVAR